MSNTLGCLFAEEIGEALLSRLSARVKLHPAALSQPALMDLFLSMPHPRMGTKTLRRKLRTGLCDLFEHASVALSPGVPVPSFCLPHLLQLKPLLLLAFYLKDTRFPSPSLILLMRLLCERFFAGVCCYYYPTGPLRKELLSTWINANLGETLHRLHSSLA